MLVPTAKYRISLTECGIINEEDKCLFDPDNTDIADGVIILQQSTPRWDYKNLEILEKIKLIITPCMQVFNQTKHYKETYVLEFPLEPGFKKTNKWFNREDAIFYHGRIVPEKVNVEELRIFAENEVRVVMRGPVCKEYWTDVDIEGELFDNFRKAFYELVEKGEVKHLSHTNDRDIIIQDLNSYKFYFTLSIGESFNLALQEAIACGTIPIVRRNDAYWWANYLMIGFDPIEEMLWKYRRYRFRRAENYSDAISSEITKRCSHKAIKNSYEKQKLKWDSL